jgi:CDP-diacylglycerol---glycerol-3-phosphate 3-phosphatidyltransferase
MNTFYRQLPNQLTLLRLVLAAVFFVLLNCYRYGAASPMWLLPVAIVVFIMAAITDSLDGYLARKWDVESKFGRIMDPFCDKVLVIGAFVYLAGPRFIIPGAVEVGDIDFFSMVTGVYPWMVAVILSRELLVTAIRGELEGEGIKFGANVFGKLKMILQSVVIPIVLAIVWLIEIDPGSPGGVGGLLYWVRDILVYFTVLVTVVSGLPYITGAMKATREKPS